MSTWKFMDWFLTAEDSVINTRCIQTRVSVQAENADYALMRQMVGATKRGSTPRICIEVYGPVPY